MDYYTIRADEFNQRSRIPFDFVDTYQDLCALFADEMVARIRSDAARNRMTVVILPVGPLDYGAFVRRCNEERVSCESLVVIAMDEHCDAEGRAVPLDHPLSFRAYLQRHLVDALAPALTLPPEQLIVPDPDDLGAPRCAIDAYGGVDVVYGGFGINGHFAFNGPPPPEVDLATFRATTTRVLALQEADIVQMAMGGLGGNLEAVPPKACTLGMSELLCAREIRLTFMRSWHAGVLRRALFGPVTPRFPGSLVQTHPNVRVTVASVAAGLPLRSILQQPGK